MANTYLSRTNSSSGTSDKIFTYSFWIKRAKVDAEHCIAGAGTSQREFIRFESTGELTYRRTSGSAFQFTTLRKFRDVGAWYNIVFNIDSRLSSGGDRVKLYVNGVSETAVSAATDMGQNYTPKIGAAELQTIGKDSEQANPYFDGCMSHVHFIDGIRYDASYFGSTDSTTGEWKINTSPSVTYGTNGFTILKDGNTITDQSSNSNNFTLSGGTLTKTEDCPSDVFATLNPLGSGTFTFSNGNNTAIRSTSSSFHTAISNLGASSGKYYAEAKAISIGSVTYGSYIGFINLDVTNKQNTAGVNIGEGTDSAGISSGGGYIYYNGNQFAGPTTATTNGDIVNLAMDLDNGRLYWGINGTYLNSGNPASGSTGTGGMPIANLTAGGTYTFGVSLRNDANYSWNFGNGYFGTTAIASEGSNASGIGIFEHDVPSGYTALSTKGLNL